MKARLQLKNIQYKNSKLETVLWAIISIATFLVVWHLLVELTRLKLLLPGPLEVFPKLFKYMVEPLGKMTLPGHIFASLLRMLSGFLLGSIAGVILGVSMATSKTVSAIVKPIFEVIRPIPGIAWIPLAILWFGIDETSKIFIIFMNALVIVTVNAFEGTTTVDPTLIGAAQMLGAKKAVIFYKVILPAAIPQIFAGLQTAMSVSWMVILAAEMVRSDFGTGWIIITGSNSGNMTQVIIGMISIGFIGFILATILRGLERRLCSWNSQGK